jgi:transposase
MSTSLLYHGFAIQGYQFVRARYLGGAVHFTVRGDPKELVCPRCGSRHVVRRGRVWRRFRSVPIGKKPVCVMGGYHTD